MQSIIAFNIQHLRSPMLGFYAIASSKISFARDGNWYADGERITNPRIAALFSRHLRREPDGSYWIRMADERAAVEIEDTPYVVRTASVGDEGVALELNDQSTERLDPATLEVGDAEVLYCRVKGRAERARFLRPAYYQLAAHLVEPQPGSFALQLADGLHAIARRRS